MFLADHDMHHALARVQTAFPHSTYGSAYERNSSVVHCLAVRLLLAGLLSSSAHVNASRLPIVHHCRLPGSSSMQEGQSWTNRSARGMMTAVMPDAMSPHRVAARCARWRQSASRRILLLSPITLTGGER